MRFPLQTRMPGAVAAALDSAYEAHAHRFAGEEPAHTAFREGYEAGYGDASRVELGGTVEVEAFEVVLPEPVEGEAGEVRLWWLSFCDPERPEGEQFLGVSIVPGRGIESAVRAAHLLGCNPGGEVQGLEVSPGKASLIPLRWLFRVLSREQCEEFDREILQVLQAARSLGQGGRAASEGGGRASDGQYVALLSQLRDAEEEVRELREKLRKAAPEGGAREWGDGTVRHMVKDPRDQATAVVLDYLSAKMSEAEECPCCGWRRIGEHRNGCSLADAVETLRGLQGS